MDSGLKWARMCAANLRLEAAKREYETARSMILVLEVEARLAQQEWWDASPYAELGKVKVPLNMGGERG